MHSANSTPPVMTPLPFVGRDKELEQIVGFYRQAVEGDGISALWISGEAGIGKTRLLQQAIAKLRDLKANPIHICLYPNSTASIVDLLADAVHADPQLEPLLTSAESRPFPSVLDVLRRLARLRPIIVILEDIHIIHTNAIDEIHSLLSGLTHEPIGLIFAARPGKGEAYNAVLPFLADTLEIQPLSLTDIETILQRDQKREEWREIAQSLHKATHGNPLILRMVLPEVLAATDELPLDGGEFIESLIREKTATSIEGLATNYIDRLIPNDRDAVYRLTTLGEIFSQEAAVALLNEDDTTLQRLVDHGIIIRSHRAIKPLCGHTESAYPFVFAHTLLYEQLVTQATCSEHELLRLMKSNAALYSTVPFAWLGKIEPDLSQKELIVSTFNQFITTLQSLDRSHASNQLFSISIVEFIQSYYQKRRDIFSPEHQLSYDLDLLSIGLETLNLYWNNLDHARDLETYLRLTESPETEKDGLHRCRALYHYSITKSPIERNYTAENILKEAEELARKFPDIVRHKNFIALLGQLAPLSWSLEIIRRIRNHFTAVSPKINDDETRFALCHGSFSLLFRWGLLVETLDEFQEYVAYRADLLKEFEVNVFDLRSTFFYPYVHSYLLIGRPLEALNVIHKELRTQRQRMPYARFSTVFKPELFFMAQRLRIDIYCAVGLPLDIIEQEIMQLIEGFHEMYGLPESGKGIPRVQAYIAVDMVMSGIKRDEVEWAERMAKLLCEGNEEILKDHIGFTQAVLKGDTETLQSLYPDVKNISDPYQPLVEIVVTQQDVWDEALIDEIRRMLETRITSFRTLYQVGFFLALLDLAPVIQTGDHPNHVLREEIVDLLERSLTWCHEYQLPGYGTPFLRRAEIHLSSERYAYWTEQFDKLHDLVMAEYRSRDVTHSSENRVLLSMISTISITLPDIGPQKIRGARLRHTLGLMVANQLMRTPLSLAEFRELATAMDADSPRVDNYLHTILSRIRNIMGHDAVITDGKSAPRLNLELVAVNLFEVDRLLDECDVAIRSIHARKAMDAATKALELINYEPAYPTLYDEFFEAARNDFEVRLRNTLFSTVRLLRSEGDFNGAGELLRKFFELMPNDEEVAEELIDILQTLGHKTEAISIRLRLNRHK